jgi:HD-GYP domain-containing protein (c-di-GMP phosphodiesterase class II)
MFMTNMSNNFFSVSFDLIILDKALPYDLYVNSSANHERERFVRIYPKNDPLSYKDLKMFKKKYFQLYIHEFQRGDYLKSMISLSGATDVQKGDIIKSSAIHYLDKLFADDKEFTTELLSETISECKVAVESMVDVIKDYDVSKLQGLIASLSFHDFYTYDHSINVSMYCISLFTAAKPNASKEEIVMAGLGGLLHDIGKIKISTDIINKPEKLSDEEFLVIKAHPTYGLELLTDNPCPDCKGVDFNVIRRVVHEHHENFNGTGYPKKIAGPDIHLLARITAIADFFDAITTKRSYHEVMSTEDAIGVMSKSVGKKIDPHLFEVFTKSLKQLEHAGKINKELPDDFDPCQPQNVLPFRTPKGFKVEGFGDKDTNPEKFGKVRKKVG